MSWHICIVNPNCHRRAEAGLAELGYQAFWPRLRKWVSHARTKKAKEFPILGRYLFVEIPDREFYHVRKVNGIEGLLTGDSGAPASIPAEIVWGFRARYMRGEWDEIAKGHHMPIGARIRIVEGEFSEMLATVTNRKGQRIDFKLFGENRYGRLNECSVRAA